MDNDTKEFYTQLILDKIRNGSVPIRIIYEPKEDSASANQAQTIVPQDSVKSYYFQASRLGYLHSWLPRIQEFFGIYGNNNCWFAHAEVPVKWTAPVGVLYDQYIGGSGDDGALLTLELNTTDYPETQIPWPSTQETLWTSVLNALKQSCYAATGSANPILNMSKADTDGLRNDLLENAKLTEYFNKINSALTPVSSSNNIKGSQLIKLYLPNFQVLLFAIDAAETVNSGGGIGKSLGVVLNSVVPDLFPSKRTCVLVKPMAHGVDLDLKWGWKEVQKITRFADGFVHVNLVLL